MAKAVRTSSPSKMHWSATMFCNSLVVNWNISRLDNSQSPWIFGFNIISRIIHHHSWPLHFLLVYPKKSWTIYISPPKTLCFSSSKSTPPVLLLTTSPGFTSSLGRFNCPSTDHSCTSCSRTASCVSSNSAAHLTGSFGVKLSRCLGRRQLDLALNGRFEDRN